MLLMVITLLLLMSDGVVTPLSNTSKIRKHEQLIYSDSFCRVVLQELLVLTSQFDVTTVFRILLIL